MGYELTDADINGIGRTPNASEPIMTIDGIELRAAAARRVERRCLRLGARRADAYRRFLAALHRTAEPDGLESWATNGAIGRLAGLSAPTVGKYLRMAEADGVVRVFRPGPDGVAFRVAVLRNHPKSGALIRHIAKCGWDVEAEHREPAP